MLSSESNRRRRERASMDMPPPPPPNRRPFADRGRAPDTDDDSDDVTATPRSTRAHADVTIARGPGVMRRHRPTDRSPRATRRRVARRAHARSDRSRSAAAHRMRMMTRTMSPRPRDRCAQRAARARMMTPCSPAVLASCDVIIRLTDRRAPLADTSRVARTRSDHLPLQAGK